MPAPGVKTMKYVNYNSLPGIAIRDAMGKKYRINEDGKEGGILVEIRRGLGDNLLEVIRLDTGAPYQIVDPETGNTRLPCGTWLEEGLSSGAIEEVSLFSTRIGNYDEVLSQQDAKTIDPMSEAKWQVLRDIHASGVSRNSPILGDIISRSWKRHNFSEKFGVRPSTRTFRRLMQLHDPATVTMGQLISLRGRVPRAPRLDMEVTKILEEQCDQHYNQRGTRICDTLAAVFAEVYAQNIERKNMGLPSLAPPSRETVRRMIGKMCTRERYERKWGKQAAERNWDGAGSSLTPTTIGELGLMDDTTLDTIVCFDMINGLPAGRPNICVLIDVVTRCVVGWVISFEGPTAFTALSTVRHANSLKDIPPSLLEKYPILRRINCAFSEILTDNGTNYVSRAFLDGMADIGTSVRLARVKRGRDKAYVERFFYTLKTMLLEKLPGFTANPDLLRAFGYDPEKEAVLTISELNEVVEKAINLYHITLHTGIGMPPALKWKRLLETSGRNVITNVTEFDVLTHETIWDVTLHRYGFTKDHLKYTDPVHVPAILAAAGAQRVGAIPDGTRPTNAAEFEANQLPDQKNDKHRKQGTRKTKPADLRDDQATVVIKCKRNSANLLTIYAQNPLTKEYLPCRAVHEDYAEGLSLSQHKAVLAYAKKANLEFNTESDQILARNELNQHIRKLAPDLDARERKALARIAEKMNSVEVEIEETFADARHDGMDGIIPVDTASKNRSDGSIKPTRPQRGGIKGAVGSAGKSPDVDDGDEPLPEKPEPNRRQRAAVSAIGKAEINDDQKWSDFA